MALDRQRLAGRDSGGVAGAASAPTSPPGPADLAADTRVSPLGDGRYRVHLPDAWDYLLPSGGVVHTAALRAAVAELGDESLALCSTTATFCSPVAAGPLELSAQVLRRGIATAQLSIDVRNPGAELGARITATFARERSGPDVRGAAMPAVRSVADALPTDSPPPPVHYRFYDQLDCKIALGERSWIEGPGEQVAGPARYARWFRYRVPQRTAAGLLDRLALPPVLDTMPTALARAIGPGGYRFYAPSLDLTAHFVDDTEREWLLLAAYVRRARAGIAIGEIEAWDDTGRLLAYGTQAMYLKTLSGEPPVVDASRR